MSHSTLVVHRSSLILIKPDVFLSGTILPLSKLTAGAFFVLFCFVFVLDFEFCQMTKRDQMCHERQILIFMGYVLGVLRLPLFYFHWMFPLQHILCESCPKQIIKKSGSCVNPWSNNHCYVIFLSHCEWKWRKQCWGEEATKENEVLIDGRILWRGKYTTGVILFTFLRRLSWVMGPCTIRTQSAQTIKWFWATLSDVIVVSCWSKIRKS